MFERDGYMPGVPCWIDTSQPDPDAAVEFYGHLFGWEFENVMPAGSGGKYFIGRLRGGDVAAVGSLPEGGPAVTAWKTYIWVQSADASAAAVEAAGGRVLAAPFDVMDAGRMAVCADPEGAAFCLWEAGSHKGARIVNEPGSLNFNGLNSRDPDGAEASTGRCSVGRYSPSESRCAPGDFPATETSSLRAIPGSARGWHRAGARRALRTWSRRSVRSPRTSPGFPRTGV